ncbi:unnamed protein product, partial [Oppiella nova]
EEVELIREDIESIRTDVEEVNAIHEKILNAPQTHESVRQSLDCLVADIKRAANGVRHKLKAMEQKIRDLEDRESDPGMSADIRIRKTQHSMLLHMFIECMTQYNAIQSDYSRRYRELFKRWAEITGQYMSDEEVDKLIDRGCLQVLIQGIVTDTQQAMDDLRDIEARHRDIVKLEKSIREVHDLFTDLSLLVDHQ